MSITGGDPPSVVMSVRIFQALLAAYPQKFQSEYGMPMVQVFRDACRRANAQGRAMLFALWVRTGIDLFKTVVEEHSSGGVHMSQGKFFKLSGWALMVGPIVFLIGWLANSRPEYNRFNAASLSIDRYANLAALPLIVFGLASISLGLIGVLLRFGSNERGTNLWLGLGAFSALTGSAGAVWMVIDENGYGWVVFFLGLFALFLSITIFGLVNLRLRLLPRWNGLPLLAGIWIPAFMMFMGIFQLGTGSALLSNENVFTYLWAFSLLIFSGLGYLLQSESVQLLPANA